MTSMKIVQYLRPPTLLSSYVQNSYTPLTLDVQFQTNPPPPSSLPLQMITSQLKEDIIQRLLLYVIRSFLHVGFGSQYKLINLVWFLLTFIHLTEANLIPRAILKN